MTQCGRSQADLDVGLTVVALEAGAYVMSRKTLWWILPGAFALGAVLLFNYWASFQPLSTLVYAGMIGAFLGLVNLAVPFRFLGIRKRLTGGFILAGGGVLAFAALHWPAPTIHVAQHQTVLDDILPQYQFSEKHSIRIHNRPQPVLEAVRQSTWADMRSLVTLLKIRGAVARQPFHDAGVFRGRILDGFAASGYVIGGSDREIVAAGGANVNTKGPIRTHSLQEFADYSEPGAVKMAFDFFVDDVGDGWSTLTAETRVFALGGSARGMARYWRLIVPGSGLLRREWLEGIKQRAESQQQ
jgi:hypothetical protein